MVAPFKIGKRLILTAKTFGFRACFQELNEIFRNRLFRSRKYFLMLLSPPDFIAVAEPSETIIVSIINPPELLPYVDSLIELSEEFLLAQKNTKAVIAKESVTGDLLGYGFFSSELTAIDEQVFFKPPEGCTYLFKFFVVPQARGERIVRRLISRVIKEQEVESSKALIAMVLADNFLSQYAFSSMGFDKKQSFFLLEGSSDIWRYDVG